MLFVKHAADFVNVAGKRAYSFLQNQQCHGVVGEACNSVHDVNQYTSRMAIYFNDFFAVSITLTCPILLFSVYWFPFLTSRSQVLPKIKCNVFLYVASMFTVECNKTQAAVRP